MHLLESVRPSVSLFVFVSDTQNCVRLLVHCLFIPAGWKLQNGPPSYHIVLPIGADHCPWSGYTDCNICPPTHIFTHLRREDGHYLEHCHIVQCSDIRTSRMSYISTPGSSCPIPSSDFTQTLWAQINGSFYIDWLYWDCIAWKVMPTFPGTVNSILATILYTLYIQWYMHWIMIAFNGII